MIQDVKYVVITPVRDEERHVEATVHSVASQTIPPVEWIIVNDGSSDRTGDILDRCAAQFPWIHVIHRPNRGFRKSGGGVIEAFYDGYHALGRDDWEFIVKLDGDLTLSPDYFEKCFEHFNEQPKLGIGGGAICHEVDGTLKVEANPKFHVRGATKIYRRACWEAIGGIWAAPGWDTIDEVKANMLDWKTDTFGELASFITIASLGLLTGCCETTSSTVWFVTSPGITLCLLRRVAYTGSPRNLTSLAQPQCYSDFSRVILAVCRG